MKISRIFWVIFLPFLTNGQEITKDFTKLSQSDDFDFVSEKWQQTFTGDNLFVIQNGYYETFRKNKLSGYYLLPDKGEEFQSFDARCRFQFETYNNKQSAGIMLMANSNGNGALVIEINQKKEYRIRRVFNDKSVMLSGTKASGWVKNTQVIRKDVNEITVKSNKKIYDLYINGVFIVTFTEIELTKGRIGLYVGAASKIKFDFLKVYTEEKVELTKTDNVNDKVMEESFTQIIIRLKDQLNKKEKEVEELRLKLRVCENSKSGSGMPDTASIRIRRELELKTSEMNAQIEMLNLEVLRLTAENKRLLAFKEEVEKQSNGDIIINLTGMVNKQKERIEELEKNKIALESEIKMLKVENDQLRNQNSLNNEQIDRLIKVNVDLDNKIRRLDSLNSALKQGKYTLDSNLIHSDSSVIDTGQSRQDFLDKLIEMERQKRLRQGQGSPDEGKELYPNRNIYIREYSY